jgi:hypothetical protein
MGYRWDIRFFRIFRIFRIRFERYLWVIGIWFLGLKWHVRMGNLWLFRLLGQFVNFWDEFYLGVERYERKRRCWHFR